LCVIPGGAAEPQASDVVARAIQAADKNHDGRLSLAEYLPLDVQAKHHGGQHFKAGDANQDGFLDDSELAATLHKQTWFAILAEGVEPCFTRLDANSDGKLDAAEYRRISRMGGHAGQHFKGADLNKDGFLDRAEFNLHAGAKLGALEVSVRRK
jgi:Ca2+-binding EF-hand superfamily protein